MGRKLTEDNLEDLRKDYGVLSNQELTEKYNCSYSTIERFCKSHGFKSKRANGRSSTKKYPYPYEHLEEFLQDWEDNVLSIEELEKKFFAPLTTLYSIAKLYGKHRKTLYERTNIDGLINDYMSHELTQEDLCKKYNISNGARRNYLTTNGVKLRTHSESSCKYEFNYHYLDSIDIEEKAYLLGFVYADGGHSEDRHSLTITIQQSDEDLLKKFYDIFECQRPIEYVYNKKYDKYYASFRLQNIHLSQQLLNLGVMGNKSFKIVFPDFLPIHLRRHFIRGYFDGDGSIGFSNRGWKSTKLQITGNENFLKSIQEIIAEETHIIMNLRQEKRSKICDLDKAGIFNIYPILNYLYKDSTIYLQRKYDRYISFITEYEKEYLNNEQDKKDKGFN